jgi:hypothetical protein
MIKRLKGHHGGRPVITSDERDQLRVFDVRQFRPTPYPVWSFYGVLERFGALIIRRDDFPEFDGTKGGQEGWDPVVVAKLELIRQRHGWTDREAVDAGHNDMRVKACLGLGIEEDGPSQPTLCRVRSQMQEHGLDEVYTQRFVELLKAMELLKEESPVAVDTVPISGAGQVQDTFNLLAGVIRRGLSRLAALMGETREATAEQLGLTRYLSRSVKGSAEIDWRDELQRRQFLAQLVSEAKRLQEAMNAALASKGPAAVDDEAPENDASNTPETETPDEEPAPGGASQLSLLNPSEPADREGGGGGGEPERESRLLNELGAVSAQLDKILEHDVEVDESGAVSGIRQKAAGDRMISSTDADMRHGRKSASSLIAGYKTQIVAAVLYGWILLTKVIPANRHDGQDVAQLIEKLAAMGLDPRYWAGDHAYGTLGNHMFFSQMCSESPDREVELIARNARPSNGEHFSKDDFRIDFNRREMTCLAGHSVPWKWATRSGERGWLFQFPDELCTECPLRQFCTKAPHTKGRSFFIVEERERVLREHLRRREEPAFRDKLKGRQVVERANAGFAQCGGKEAHRFGREATQFASNLSALAYNLRLLASVAAESDNVQEALEARARALVLVLVAIACTVASRTASSQTEALNQTGRGW